MNLTLIHVIDGSWLLMVLVHDCYLFCFIFYSGFVCFSGCNIISKTEYDDTHTLTQQAVSNVFVNVLYECSFWENNLHLYLQPMDLFMTIWIFLLNQFYLDLLIKPVLLTFASFDMARFVGFGHDQRVMTMHVFKGPCYLYLVSTFTVLYCD